MMWDGLYWKGYDIDTFQQSSQFFSDVGPYGRRFTKCPLPAAQGYVEMQFVREERRRRRKVESWVRTKQCLASGWRFWYKKRFL
jgi:hypothetical protein